MPQTLRHDASAEKCLLGNLFHAANSEEAGDEYAALIFEQVRAEDFFTPEHRAIFSAAQVIHTRGERCYPDIVARNVRGVEGPAAECLEALHSVAGVGTTKAHVEIIRKAAGHRRLVLATLEAMKAAESDSDTDHIVDTLASNLEALKAEQAGARLVTGEEAAAQYMRFLTHRPHGLPRTALAELDHALGGGVDFGEMIVLAARPSHGKTAIALQFLHQWTEDQIPVLYVSVEMSATALGKRIMQYSSDVHEEDWRRNTVDLQSDVSSYFQSRAPYYIADGINSIESVASEVEKSVKQRGVKAVVIDYAQLLHSPGKSRYEQITHTSTRLRNLASQHNIIMLVLCQMSREIENRKKFTPIMSDIKESGQFEQDADAIVFLVWPHRIDSAQPAHEYQFYVAKNRNRPILNSAFVARFEPSRQRVVSQRASDLPNYEPSFDGFEPCDEPFGKAE